MKWVLDNAGKVITAISLALLVLAVFHDWGYYLVLGPHLQSIQTPYDYLAHSIEWLPLNGGIMFSGAVLSLLLGRRAGAGKVNLSEYPSGIRDLKLQKSGGMFLILFYGSQAMVLLVIMVFLPIPFDSSLVYGELFMLACFVIILWLMTRSVSRIRTYGYASSVALPIIFSFLAGSVDASWGLNSLSNVYKIERKDEPTIVANLLRSLEKGVLVWDSGNSRVTLIRWEQVKQISHRITPPTEAPIPACRYLNLLCPENPEP